MYFKHFCINDSSHCYNDDDNDGDYEDYYHPRYIRFP